MKKIVLVLCLALLLTGCAPAAQTPDETTASPSTPSLALQSESSSLAKGIMEQLAAQEPSGLWYGGREIEDVVSLLFMAGREQMRYPDMALFDFTVFWDPEAEDPASLKNFEYYVEYAKKSLLLQGTYLECNVDVDFKSIDIQESTAEAVVYVRADYEVRSLKNNALVVHDDTTPFITSGNSYTVRLKKLDNGWYITAITFHADHWSSDRSIENVDIDKLLLDQ